jgi:hypothetical protein
VGQAPDEDDPGPAQVGEGVGEGATVVGGEQAGLYPRGDDLDPIGVDAAVHQEPGQAWGERQHGRGTTLA